MLEKIRVKYNNISLPAKASLWFMFTNVVNKGISFITTPLFTRVLTQEEYGVLSLYNTWMVIITIFATFQLATGVFNKAMIKYSDDKDGYTSSSLTLASILTAGLFLVYIAFRRLLNPLIGLTTPLMIMMFVEIFFTTTWSLYSVRNRFDYKYRSIVLVTIFTNLFATLLSLFLVIKIPEHRVEAKIAGIVIVRCIFYSFAYYHLMRKGKTFVRGDYWKYSLGYNLPLIPHYLSQQVLNQSDRIMISHIFGNADAAIYSLSYQLAAIMQIVTEAIQATFMPWCFQTIRAGDVKKIGKRALQIEILLGITCVLFCLFAPEFIMILGGANYYRAVYIVPPVSMSILFITIYSFFANIEFYFEKTRLVMYASCAVALANIILNAIFIPILGFVAAGYTTLFCYIVYSAIHYIIMINICTENGVENPFPAKMMWGIASVFAFISIVFSFIYEYFFFRYSLILIIGVILVAFFVRNRKEILGK